jgi:hypothetical protein
MTVCNEIPVAFAAGDTLEYRAPGLIYPPSEGWARKFWLKGPTLPDDSPLLDGVDADVDGDSFVISVPADHTASLTFGGYRWAELASKAGKRFTARSGEILVTPNIELVTGDELADADEKLLASVNDQIAKRVAKDISRMSEYSRAIEREQLDQLWKLKATLEQRIAARRRGSDQRESIRAAFRRP